MVIEFKFLCFSKLVHRSCGQGVLLPAAAALLSIRSPLKDEHKLHMVFFLCVFFFKQQLCSRCYLKGGLFCFTPPKKKKKRFHFNFFWAIILTTSKTLIGELSCCHGDGMTSVFYSALEWSWSQALVEMKQSRLFNSRPISPNEQIPSVWNRSYMFKDLERHFSETFTLPGLLWRFPPHRCNFIA